MRKAFYASAIALLGLAAGPVLAMPIAPLSDDPGITLIEGGCGWGFHRAANGVCYRNAPAPGVVVGGPVVGVAPLPPGWFYYGGRRCWWRAPGVRVCT
jgi:hypothetical protein